MQDLSSLAASLRRGLGWYLVLGGLLLTAPIAAQAQTGNVGIGTTAPTQTLDVNGQLRVRGLSGTDTRLPTVGPDGTLGVSAPVFSTPANTATPIPTAATGTAGTGPEPRSVAVSGTTVYVVSRQNNTLQAFDVSNPASPVLLGQATTESDAVSVAVSGTTAYTAIFNNSSGSGLQVFDVSNPASPVPLGVTGGSGGSVSVAVSSTRVCLVDFYRLSAYTVGPAGGVPGYLGDEFLNASSSGASNPGQPTSVAVSGTTALVTLSNNTLQAFDVSAGKPVRTGQVSTAGSPQSVVVSGTTAFVASGGSGGALQTFNIANPNNPVLLSTVPTGGFSRSVAVSGTRAYVATDATLQVFDVANPVNPVLLGTVPLGGTLTSVAASGNTAYVTNQNNTLQVVAFSSTPPDRVVTVGPTGSLGSVALPGAADFVQNQTATPQVGGFSVSGAGTVGGLLTAGSATVGGQVYSSTGGFRFPDNTVQTTAGLTGGSAIRNQTTQQSGASFNIDGSGYVGGSMGIGTTTTAAAQLAVVAADNSANPIATFQPQNETQGVSLTYYGIRKTGTNATSDLTLDGKSTGNILLHTTASTGNVGIGTIIPSFKLDVNGSLRCTGAVNTTSDARLKQGIQPIGSALAGVLALRGVRYTFRQAEFRQLNLPAGAQIGVLAQEVEQVYPELVSTDAQGYKAVNYAQLTPVLIEALKEQQQQIEALKQETATAKAEANSAKAQAAQTMATLETFEARLRRLEVGTAQAQR